MNFLLWLGLLPDDQKVMHLMQCLEVRRTGFVKCLFRLRSTTVRIQGWKKAFETTVVLSHYVTQLPERVYHHETSARMTR